MTNIQERDMKNIIRAIRSINFRQILTVFLAGCLLVISTACSQDDVAKTGTTAKTEASRLASDTYDKYDANQDYKGGINAYNDDRRYNAKTAAKAKGLVDTAKRRQADDLGEYVDNVKERAINEKTTKKATAGISRRLEENKDNALGYIDDKSDKLQRNLGKVPGGAKDVFDEATDTAQGAVKDATKAAKTNTNNVKENFKDLS
jgi:gas vesicle protein